MHGRHSQALRLGDLFDGQPGEEAHFHDLCFPGINGFELFEHGIEKYEIDMAIHPGMYGRRLIEGYELQNTAPLFLRALFPGTIYKDFTHFFRSEPEEMLSSLPVNFLTVYKPDEKFVDEDCRLPGVRVALAGEIASCSTAKFPLNKRSKFVHGPAVSRAPLSQQSRDVVVCHFHRPPPVFNRQH